MNGKVSKTQDQSASRQFGQAQGCGYHQDNICGNLPGCVPVSQKTDGSKYSGLQTADQSDRENSILRSGSIQVKRNFYPAFVYPVVIAITALLWWLFFSIIF
ncbi:MAG: hypothetical protein J0H92_07855 [Sphingobacteriales bacterium]|nr:hypothetical protein [Sphingobacteriales bacterium]